MAKSKTARKRKLLRREKHKAERQTWENVKKTRLELFNQTMSLEFNPPEDNHQTFSPWASDASKAEAKRKRETFIGFEF